jgi:hypothetical protein
MKACKIVVVVALGCTVLLAAPAVSLAADTETELGELREQRHLLLVKEQGIACSEAEAAQKAFDAGIIEPEELLKAYQHLLDMRLQFASTPSQRITALEEYIRVLSPIESKLQVVEEFNARRTRPFAGRGIESVGYRKIKLAILNAKIALLEEKERKSPLKLVHIGTMSYERIDREDK